MESHLENLVGKIGLLRHLSAFTGKVMKMDTLNKLFLTLFQEWYLNHYFEATLLIMLEVHIEEDSKKTEQRQTFIFRCIHGIFSKDGENPYKAEWHQRTSKRIFRMVGRHRF